MARRANISFEWEEYDWASAYATGLYEADGGLDISTTHYKGGSKSAECTSLSSGTPKYWGANHGSSTNTVGIYARFWLRIGTAPGANTSIFGFGSNNTTWRLGIRLTTGRKLQLLNGGTQVGSDSDALTIGTWYRVDIHYDYSETAGSQVLTARLDGSQFATSSSETLGGSLGAMVLMAGGNIQSEANSSGTWQFASISINDDTGTDETSYPPDAVLTMLRPNAAGDAADGSGTGGGAAAYLQVDEDVPDIGTTYWDLVDNADELLVNIEAYADGGIGASDTINLLEVKAMIGAPGTGGLYPGTMIKAGSTQDEADTARQNGASYYPYAYYSPALYVCRGVWYENPDDSAAWEPGDITGLQIGCHTTDAGPDNRINALACLVEYTPSSGTPVTVEDTGEGDDNVSVDVQIGVTDSAECSDNVEHTAVIGTSDAGAGVDVPTFQTTVGVADAGEGEDVPDHTASLAVADAAAGVDAPSLTATLTVTDTGSGDDVASVLAAAVKVVQDAGVGSDGVQVAVSLSVADTGSGADVPALTATITATDAGSAADVVDVITAIVKVVEDSGSGAEAVAVTASQAVQDAASGEDVPSFTTSVEITDTGSGADVVSVVQQILVAVADSAAGVDAAAIDSIVVSVADSAAGADAVGALVAALLVSDSGAAVDVASMTTIEGQTYHEVKVRFATRAETRVRFATRTERKVRF